MKYLKHFHDFSNLNKFLCFTIFVRLQNNFLLNDFRKSSLVLIPIFIHPLKSNDKRIEEFTYYNILLF